MQYFLAITCALAILVCQYFYAGIFIPVFSFPSYLLLAVGALISGVVAAKSARRTPDLFCFCAVFGFFLWMMGRTWVSMDTPGAPAFFQLILGCFLIYLMMGYSVVSAKARMAFVICLVVGAVAQSAAAGGQFFGVTSGPPQGWISEQLRLWYDRGSELTTYRRAHGFYINGNHLAWFLNAAGFFGLALGAFGRGGAVVKILWFYVGGMCLAASLACLSRGGLIAMGCGFLFAFVLALSAVLFGSNGRRVASFFLVLAAFAIPALVVWVIVDQNFAVQAKLNLIAEDTYRPLVWQAAIREFQLHPIWGAGPGAFAVYVRAFRSMFSFTDDYFAHNDWLQLAADFGFPAFALALLAVGVHLIHGWRMFLRILKEQISLYLPQSNSAALLLGAGAAVAGFAAHSLFDFNLQLPANALLAAACMGLLVSSRERRSASIDKKSVGMVALGYLVPVLSIGGALALAISLWSSRNEIERFKAENHLLSGQPGEAVQISDQALQRPGAEFRLLFIRAAGALQLAESASDQASRQVQLKLAVESLKRAIEIAPAERSAAILLTRSTLWGGNLAEAKRLDLEVIRLEPRQTEGYELYGRILETQGQFTEARNVYLLAASIKASPFVRERLNALELQLK